MKPLLTTLILSFFILPLITFAQYTPPIADGVITGEKNGLVPCEGSFCGTCDVIVLANTGIKWLLTLTFLFFAVLAVRAGVKLITSQGNSGALSEAKQSFTNAFIGLIIMLVAWLIVDTMMRQLLKGGDGYIENYGPWSKVQCTEQEKPVSPEDQKGGYFAGDNEFVPSSVVAGGTSVSSVPESGMISLNSLGINVANGYKGISDPGRTDLVHPTVANAILSMQNAGILQFGKKPFLVTAAYTRNVGHTSGSFHYQGVAVDLQPINGVTFDQIIKLCRDARFTYVKDERAANHIHCDMR